MPTDVTAQQAQQLIDYAVARLGRIEGNGQCWTLVNNGFQHLRFYKPSATYAWGRSVELSAARPGDVFQFTNFKVRVENPDGSWREEERGDPHHTAILESIDSNGYATFLESNVYNNKNVQRRRYHVKTADLNGTNGRTTVRVSGSYIVYRPQMP
ncbi:hypothetical protein [Roseibium aggregatum]|uniref:BBC1/AIM3 cysteine proteinase-fold domain-containing protein n=1 Tax=Roseibium aggregatum TaxID=187304 RepID=A0A939J2K1_9HYPH|nr:hypothetical protein [Roseibium aggregatum]MBN9673271.1 hypothetical protein [Roseibium aggregatum]